MHAGEKKLVKFFICFLQILRNISRLPASCIWLKGCQNVFAFGLRCATNLASSFQKLVCIKRISRDRLASQPLVCQRVPSRDTSRSVSLLNALPAYPILRRSGVLELLCRCVSCVDCQTGRIVKQSMHAIQIT
jgi:hypothetical protein